MSSLARRTVCTTAAAAGIAALGVGIAGHAIAAPELPALPGADGLEMPAAPDLGASPDYVSGLPGAASGERSELPGVFVFEMPTVSTATANPFADNEFDMTDESTVPSFDALPEPPLAGSELPEAPSTDGIVNTDGAIDDVEGPELSPESFTENNRVGALPSLDTAVMFAELAQQAMDTQDSMIA